MASRTVSLAGNPATKPRFHQPGLSLNGIVSTPDGRFLIAIQSNTGQFWRIEPGSKAVVEINTGERLQNGDGLVLQGQNLYVIRNAQGEVVKLTMNADFSAGQVASRLTYPSFRFPTTGVGAGGRLWLVNGQLDKQRDPPPVLPFTVVGVPVP